MIRLDLSDIYQSLPSGHSFISTFKFQPCSYASKSRHVEFWMNLFEQNMFQTKFRAKFKQKWVPTRHVKQLQAWSFSKFLLLLHIIWYHKKKKNTLQISNFPLVLHKKTTSPGDGASGIFVPLLLRSHC